MRASVMIYRRRADGAVTSAPALLTTQHAASSYGLPVVVAGGVALGAAELEGVLLTHDGVTAGRAEAAGYRVAMTTDEAAAMLGPAPTREADVRVEQHGTVAVLYPITVAGRAWLEAHATAAGWQWIGAGLAVEPRRVPDLVAGLDAAGLRVG